MFVATTVVAGIVSSVCVCSGVWISWVVLVGVVSTDDGVDVG